MKEYDNENDHESHFLFKEIWQQNIYMGFKQMNDLGKLIHRLKKELDRMYYIVFHTAPYHEQYNSRHDKKWGELVMLWARLMSALSYVNTASHIEYEMELIDKHSGTKVGEYIDRCGCPHDILPEEYCDPGPMPDWLKKELEEQGHPLPDDEDMEERYKKYVESINPEDIAKGIMRLPGAYLSSNKGTKTKKLDK